MSTHFAEQVERAQSTPEEQAAALFRIALSREPAARERQLFTEFIRAHGLANACRTIFNLNEFVFID